MDAVAKSGRNPPSKGQREACGLKAAGRTSANSDSVTIRVDLFLPD